MHPYTFIHVQGVSCGSASVLTYDRGRVPSVLHVVALPPKLGRAPGHHHAHPVEVQGNVLRGLGVHVLQHGFQDVGVLARIFPWLFRKPPPHEKSGGDGSLYDWPGHGGVSGAAVERVRPPKESVQFAVLMSLDGCQAPTAMTSPPSAKDVRDGMCHG